MSTVVSISIAERIGTLTLLPVAAGKPPTLNHTVLDRLDEALGKIENAAHSHEVDLLFLRSAAEKYFCVGADIGSLQTIDEESMVPWVQRGHEVFNRLEDLPLPVVARVEGYALGGGLELAMACDVIFAAEKAQFGQTESKLGFVAGWGGSCRLPRRVGLARAKELLFSGRVFDAAEASDIGLIEFCGSPDELEARCRQFAESVNSGSRVSHAGHKRLLRASLASSREEACENEAAESKISAGSESTRERVRAFLESRKKPRKPTS